MTKNSGLARNQTRERDDRVEEREHELAQRFPWLLPLSAGIFLGAAIFEMFPEAFAQAGASAGLWAVVGLVLFIVVRDGLDYLGQHGLAWVATLGIWLHSFLEGAVTATSYGISFVVGLLVSAGMILHLIPEVGAVIVLLTAAGISLRSALIRNGITWLLLIAGFVVTFLYWQDLPPSVLGNVLAFGAGGFLYLAYLSFKERQWGLASSLALVVVGALLVGALKVIMG
ncbi:MAG: hypothetical protein M5U01_08650 [Ardenticatenaceae bacterium]|nr:hypothetical protein [Ardenticatenaceae bacterium]